MATVAAIIPGSHRSPQPTLDLDGGIELPITARFALATLPVGTVALLTTAASSGQRSGASALKASRPATLMLSVTQPAWAPTVLALNRVEPPDPIVRPAGDRYTERGGQRHRRRTNTSDRKQR
jgi:hypothetical protein